MVLLLPVALVLAFQPDPAMLRKAFEDQLSRREREFGLNDPRTAAAARDLGFYLRDAGETKSAAAAFTKALRIDEAKFGPTAPQALAGMIALASVSPPVTAEALLRRTLASPYMNSHLAVPALTTLGDLRFAVHDRSGATGYWRLALQHAELVYGKESDESGKILNSLSQVVEAKEAVEMLQRALLIAKHVWGERHPETATLELNLSRALLQAGRRPEAAEKAQHALSTFQATLGPQHPRVAAASAVLSQALTASRPVRK